MTNSTAVPLSLPKQFSGNVAFDAKASTLYIEERFCKDPLIYNWQHLNRQAGHHILLAPCPLTKIVQMRQEGMLAPGSSNSNDANALDVRSYALDLLTTAASYGASDVHLMMRGTHADVAMTILGKLRHFATLHQEEGDGIARAIYQGIATTKDSMYKELEIQNAQIAGSSFPAGSGISSARIVRGPCYPQDQNGSFMTVRLQYYSTKARSQKSEGDPSGSTANTPQALSFPERPAGLVTLNLSPKQLKKLELLRNAPAGLNIISGPTGSGKTYTIFCNLKQLAQEKPWRRQITIEDPVEFPMPWAVQLAVVNAKDDESAAREFLNFLRASLRMAPDILLIGEIRGPLVALAALEAALTGHLVWVTIHVTDPFLALDRLEMMDYQALAKSRFCDPKIVRSLIAQRLVPVLCPHCSTLMVDADKEDAHTTEPMANTIAAHIRANLATWGDTSRVRIKGPGCAHCHGEGFIARQAIAEIVLTDEALMADFLEHGTAIARKNYRARPDADAPMLDQAIVMVLDGKLDPRDVEDKVDVICARGAQSKGALSS